MTSEHYDVIHDPGAVPIKLWTRGVPLEDEAQAVAEYRQTAFHPSLGHGDARRTSGQGRNRGFCSPDHRRHRAGGGGRGYRLRDDRGAHHAGRERPARQSRGDSLRENLNHFARHGVFEDVDVLRKVAAKLSDANEIRSARVFPYQLLTAFQATAKLPGAIGAALQDAMEVATRNVPTLHGDVVVAVDVSGSMASPVTGYRKGSTTATRCVDAAALVAACIQRTHPGARVMPFDTDVRELRLNPRDSVMTQA